MSRDFASDRDEINRLLYKVVQLSQENEELKAQLVKYIRCNLCGEPMMCTQDAQPGSVVSIACVSSTCEVVRLKKENEDLKLKLVKADEALEQKNFHYTLPSTIKEASELAQGNYEAASTVALMIMFKDRLTKYLGERWDHPGGVATIEAELKATLDKTFMQGLPAPKDQGKIHIIRNDQTKGCTSITISHPTAHVAFTIQVNEI